jgi:hypothetical protein
MKQVAIEKRTTTSQVPMRVPIEYRCSTPSSVPVDSTRSTPGNGYEMYLLESITLKGARQKSYTHIIGLLDLSPSFFSQ